MKLRLITVGKPKLTYAKLGWEEYLRRLARQHTVQVIQLPDKQANDGNKILAAGHETYRIVLDAKGKQLTSHELAVFIAAREQESKEVSYCIGGPEGLPPIVIEKADYTWSLGKLTLPHDLAMVVMLEALYRASMIRAGHPYHK